MSKRFIITSLFAVIALTLTAQDKHIRVDSESTDWRKKNCIEDMQTGCLCSADGMWATQTRRKT